ncbi:MAG: MFS transporter [Deinococcus-Thermus bacterium]|nr:MFS transporter [Deinococcota bacterium]
MPAPPPRRSRMIERSPLPYAWVVLGTAIVTTMATVPGQTVGVSVFLDPILAELELSRSTVSALYMVGTLLGSFSLPFVGRFIDARGPRLAVGLIAGAFAIACVVMSGVTGLATLALGFVLVRGLGQGSLSLVSLHAVNLWFVRRRGLAIGLTGLGMAIATALFPSLLEALIGRVGWRDGYRVMAAMVAGLALPLGVAFFRSAPERYGHVPDGHRAGRAAPAPVREANLSLAEARRTFAFWILAAGDVAVAALSTGLVFHHFDIVAQAGVGRTAAAAMFLPLGLISAAANVGTGALLDRIAPRFALATMLVFQAVALALGGWAAGPLLWVYGAAIGMAQGMKGAIAGAVFAAYFGRRHIGAIKGFATTLSVAGTALGPLVFALGRDLTGGYLAVLLASVAMPLALAAASLRLRPPEPPGEDGPASPDAAVDGGGDGRRDAAST